MLRGGQATKGPLGSLGANVEGHAEGRINSANGVCAIIPQLRHHKESLGHVDTTPRLLDPYVDIDTLPNKRSRKRIKLFRQGELGS